MEDHVGKAVDAALGPVLLAVVPERISPDHITAARALCIGPLMVWGYEPVIAVTVLLVSSAFDIFDGVLARARNRTTENGGADDAMADKVFLHIALLTVCFDRVHIAFVVSVIAIDLAIAAVRRIKRRYMAPQESSEDGKRKTQALSVAIGLVLTNEPYLVCLAPIAFVLALYYGWKSLEGHYVELSHARTTAHQSRASM